MVSRRLELRPSFLDPCLRIALPLLGRRQIVQPDCVVGLAHRPRISRARPSFFRSWPSTASRVLGEILRLERAPVVGHDLRPRATPRPVPRAAHSREWFSIGSNREGSLNAHAIRSGVRSQRWVACAAFLAPLAAGEPASHPVQTVIRDSAGITIVESSGRAWAEGEGWTVDAAPALDLTRSGMGEAPEFYRVHDAMILPNGDIAVGTGTEIRFFSASGSTLALWEGRAMGPVRTPSRSSRSRPWARYRIRLRLLPDTRVCGFRSRTA
jgi:hypothetical protein